LKGQFFVNCFCIVLFSLDKILAGIIFDFVVQAGQEECHMFSFRKVCLFLLFVVITMSAEAQIELHSNMVLVNGGTFRMGNHNGESDEKPVHSVTVNSFYMGITEVTQKEWIAIMGKNPSHFKGDNLPVEQVSWLDAVDFCNKLSQKEGLTPAYRISGKDVVCDFTANGYRLPTEAEWEYAAGEGKDPAVYDYSGGSNADSVGWYAGNSNKTTHPVGTKAANSLGLYDMSGNVWEWCWDWNGSYNSESTSNPHGASSGAYRIERGGGWGSEAKYLRSTYRHGLAPSRKGSNLGFRLVRSGL
jgi:formylglycine-generating enzyme required for sulfatase activity